MKNWGSLFWGILLLASVVRAEEPEMKDGMVVKRMKLTPERRAALESATMTFESDPPKDVFVVEDSVLLEDALHLGAEVHVNAMKPWNPEVNVNMWNPVASFEPYAFRHYWIVSTNIVATETTLQDDNATHWGLYQDDFFTGGTLRLYRIGKNKYLELIHTSEISAFDADENGPKSGQRPKRGTLTLASPGPVAKPGDVYVIDKFFTEFPGNVTGLSQTPEGKHMAGWLSNLSVLKFSPGASGGLDPSTFAPEGGSTASLKIQVPGDRSVKGIVWMNPFDDSNDWKYEYAVYFHPGRTYRCEVWLKQEGLSDGKVTVEIAPFIREEVTVGEEWKKYEFDVPIRPPQEGKTSPNHCVIGAKTPGTLWVDNLLVYDTEAPKFGFMPEEAGQLKAMKPATLRSMHFNLYRYSLEGMLRGGFRELSLWNPNGAGGVRAPSGMGLGEFLRVCKETGADPWINVHFFTPEECREFIEYLAGSADSPYGRRRVEDGQTEPWTEVFGKIHIEWGNEAWGTLFFPMPAPVFVAGCNHIFSEMKKSPFYVKEKFDFVAGGWAIMSQDGGWNHTLVRDGVELDSIGATAGYIGGWDGLIVPGSSDEDFFQSQLFYVPLIEEPRVEAARELLERMGRLPGKSENPLNAHVYEFGPGYAVPGPDKPFVPASETVGKSLALGVATFDRAMLSPEYGLNGVQSYYCTGAGPNWSSYSDWKNMYPHCSWLALILANNQCRGDYLSVKAEAVQKVNLPEKLVFKMGWQGDVLDEKIQPGRAGVEMVKCHAFRDGSRYAVAVYNRWFDKSREVTVKLPFQPGKTVLHKLTHENPRSTNIKEYNVRLQEQEIKDVKPEYTFTLPPSSIYVLVSESP